MRAQLLYRTGSGSGATFRIDEIARIGRDASNEVPLAREGVSRLHATVRFEGGSFWLEDSGSTNGTFLNGKRVKKERLNHLDVVSLGLHVDLIFLARAGPAGEVPLKRGITLARLVAIDGPEPGSARDVPKGTLTVGRTTACNVVIDSAAVSKMHARIERTQEGVVITDLGSSNGTFVNGMRISAAPLHDGDRVVFAAVREYRVELEYGSLPGSFVASSGGDIAKTRMEMPGTSSSSKSLWRMRYDFTPGENSLDDSVAGKKRTLEATAMQEKVKAEKLAPKPEPKAEAPAPKPAPPAAPPPVPKPPPVAEAVKPVPKPEPPAPRPAPPVPVVSREVAMPSPSQLSPPSAAPPPEKPAPPPAAPAAEKRGGAVSGAVLTGSKQTYRVGLGSHTIGRVESAAIAIPETKVSRHHATLEVSEAGVVLKDLGSANGTYVNGEKIVGATSIEDGDRIIFGEIAFTAQVLRQ
ncbi:MAG TPA: FHA domain-containing protein [Thermoanaerobaculia bacterium]|jgi:pSer/pThr/pTyr-binding forkhead associated (FHA) protein|nr:FHA domain-containing protein [Thermoanaerobaculia bacterium]